MHLTCFSEEAPFRGFNFHLRVASNGPKAVNSGWLGGNVVKTLDTAVRFNIRCLAHRRSCETAWIGRERKGKTDLLSQGPGF